MNDVEHYEFVVLLLNASHEVQRGISEDFSQSQHLPLENNFIVTPLKEVGQLTATANNHCADLFKVIKFISYLTLDVCSLLLGELLVVLVHSCLAVSADE